MHRGGERFAPLYVSVLSGPCGSCVFFVANLDRPDNKAVPESDDALTSLMDEYLACTREAVVSRNVFGETAQPSSEGEPHPGRPDARSGQLEPDRNVSWERPAIAIYLIGVVAALVAASAHVLIAAP